MTAIEYFLLISLVSKQLIIIMKDISNNSLTVMFRGTPCSILNLGNPETF